MGLDTIYSDEPSNFERLAENSLRLESFVILTVISHWGILLESQLDISEVNDFWSSTITAKWSCHFTYLTLRSTKTNQADEMQRKKLKPIKMNRVFIFSRRCICGWHLWMQCLFHKTLLWWIISSTPESRRVYSLFKGSQRTVNRCSWNFLYFLCFLCL